MKWAIYIFFHVKFHTEVDFFLQS